ncbi:MAG: T9SS type A sorting domain-containing protein [Paludibacteraceae bacterium]
MRTGLSVFFLLAAVIFGMEKLNAETENPLVSEIQLTKGDSTFRFLYLYNTNKEKVLETKYIQIGNSRLRSEQTEWIYFDNVCVEQHIRHWKNNTWAPHHLIRFNFLGSQLESETHFNTLSGIEEKLSKTTYGYELNRLVNKTLFTWQHSNWAVNSVTTFEYNATSQSYRINFEEFRNGIKINASRVKTTYTDLGEIKTMHVSNLQDEEWVNSTFSTYYYKPNSTLKISEIVKIWNEDRDQWENTQYSEYQYDELGRLLFENYLFWDISSWKNNLKYGYTYNSDGTLSKKTIFLPIYNDYRPAWSVNYSEFKYAKASLIEAKNEFWGGDTGTPFNTFIPYQFNEDNVISSASKINISYTPVITTETLLSSEENSNRLKIYPNPSNAIFYINTDNLDIQGWQVTDLSGKVLMSKEQKDRSGVIDLGNFKPGIYLIQVHTAEGTKMQKLIKE